MATLLLVGINTLSVLAQPSTVADCNAVLKSQDYYSFAQQDNLQIDYIRSIDSQTFEQIKHDASAGQTALLPAGLFSANESYSDFNEKRQRYLDNTHYNRTESQATNILQITISPRAYTAYAQCLEHISQQGLIVWAAKEDTNSIELHVKYQNPSQIHGMQLEGLVNGGLVQGSIQGHLWRDGARWGVNQEKVFTIKRSPGSSQTTVIVAPADGSAPFTKTYYRADATFALSYVGTTDVLRARNLNTSVGTPNNDHNGGHCANEVGHQDGKWCISRTPISFSTTAPRFLTNARVDCQGGACPWTGHNPTGSISADGFTASGSLDNWGSSVTVVLTVDQYEHLSQIQCGSDGPIPAIFGQTVVFTAPKECLPIAAIRWKQLSDGSEKVFHFGEPTSPDAKLVLESTLDLGTAEEATYKVVQ
jgi:hypothetical protein